jgi:type IV pilus assembly protein PilC
MIYPVVVMTAAFGIVLGLMTFVIPTFQTTLQEMVGGKLNPVTTTVLAISDWIAHRYGWAVLAGVPIAIVFLLRLVRKTRPGRVVLDTVTLKLPVIGQLASKISITRWTRTLGTLISAGVPILDAINVTRETAGNEVFANMLANVHNSIRQGDTFAGPLKASKTVDLLVSNMVAVGEETGDLDKMLLKVADQYDEQVDVLVGGLMSMLEPMIILVLGSTVMVIVLSVFLPMIQVITSLSAAS